VEILTSGQLLSRTDSAALRKLDVADPGVIATTTAAHDSVRFYFRPRTPTQYHIEGIRKSTELLRPQAPVLVVFVLDALAILSRSGTRVSDGNMQASQAKTKIYDNEQGLYGLDFDSIYHDGSFDPQSAEGREIIRAVSLRSWRPRRWS